MESKNLFDECEMEFVGVSDDVITTSTWSSNGNDEEATDETNILKN